MTPIKLIALDLDDTLLTTDKRVTPYTKDVLRACLDAGIHLLTASGRYYPSQHLLLKQFGLGLEHTPQIGNGGGVIFQDNRVIEKLGTMTDKAYQAVLNTLREAGALCYADDGITAYYDAKDHPEMAYPYGRHPKAGYLEAAYTGDLAALSDVLRVIVYCKDEKELNTLLQMPLPDGVSIYHGGRTVLEITSDHLNKWQAIEYICDKAQIPLDAVAAIGDSQNDVPMIRGAGLGMTVANGDAPIKAAADIIGEADNDHDGAAKLIVHEILNRR